MSEFPLTILAAQCLQRCERLAEHTEVTGELTRRFLTPPMVDVHHDVRQWMQAAGMSTRVDDAGNVIGRRPGTVVARKTLLIGSHLDTVPNAGQFDGILGVMIGIAVVQAIQGEPLPFAIEVVGFSEEEGVRFATPYIGSRAIAGRWDPTWLDRRDAQGNSMRQVMESFGLTPDNVQQATYHREDVLGFIEPHIEQGPVLARASLPVASVDAIAGQSRLIIVFRGQAGHAGTMPMTPRQDALVAAARWIVDVSQFAKQVDGLRATVGYVDVAPNVRNVIPSSVSVSLDVRHAIDSVRENAVMELRQRAVELSQGDGVTVAIREQQDQRASQMAPWLTEALNHSIEECGVVPQSIVSGAGHDAVVMAECFPTAMLFIRQPRGISHHPDEDVDVADVAIAIEVICQFIKRIAAHMLSNEGTTT